MMTAVSIRAAPIQLRASRRASFRAGASRRVSVVRAFRGDEEIKEAGKDIADKVSSQTSEIADKITAWWEASEEKPTIVAVGFAGLLALYFANSVVSAVDRLPIFSTVFELIGLTFSAWTAYRFFLVDGEKEKLASEIKGFASKVGLDL